MLTSDILSPAPIDIRLLTLAEMATHDLDGQTQLIRFSLPKD